MSDLSTQRALAASNPLAGLRAESSKGANSSYGINGTVNEAGGESFSSVLNDKVARQKDKEPATERETETTASTTNPASAASSPKEAEPPRESRDESTTEDVPAGSPIAAVLLQLLPSNTLNTSSAGQASQAGTLNWAMLPGMSKTPATNGLATDVPQVEASLSGEGSAGENPLLSTADGASASLAEAAAGMVDTAIAADSEPGSGSHGKATVETDFAQLLNRMQESAGQPTTAATHASERTGNVVHMEHAAGHPNWSNELGDKMTWMVTSQKQQAELVLNPPQLGRIEVSLTITGDQANAVFTSPNAAVREMIENSLPRLREIMAGSGMNLGQADVGAQSSGQQQQTGHNGHGHGNSSGSGRLGGLAELAPTPENTVNSAGSMNLGRPGARNGAVDIFA